jgi:hypothetical protein
MKCLAAHRPAVLRLLALLAMACGPRPTDDGDDPGEDAARRDAGDEGCEESSCPISCADRTCIGALGIGRCIDDECSPSPIECVTETSAQRSCTAVCASRNVVCVENGCEGATAFGYPGPVTHTIGFCGESTPSIRDAVVPIEGPCDAPLAFAGEGSFELYQCCCDDPEH